MKIGGKYNWKGQPERLIYIGRNWSGNGYWHQFEKVDDPGKVWCEVLDTDLHMIEETETETDDGQESETWAVKAFRHKNTGEIRYALSTPPHDETEWEDVYISTAPPSAPAIETAAITKCAEVCKRFKLRGIGPENDKYNNYIEKLSKEILALIPQDGRTQLESFGMVVAESVKELCLEYSPSKDRLRIAVYHATNSIGVPPLNSETVRGAGNERLGTD